MEKLEKSIIKIKKKIGEHVLALIYFSIFSIVAIIAMAELKIYKIQKQKIQDSYNRAFYDLVSDMNNIEAEFVKLKISSSNNYSVTTLATIFAKANDVLTFIEQGVADIGIVGKDTLEESDFVDYYELLDLNIGKCYFALAGFDWYKEKILKRRKKIATKYPNIAKNYFRNISEDVEIIKMEGSVELAPIVGMTDGIVDIVETGNTLKANGLKVIDKVCDVSTRLIVNKVSLKYKSDEIYKFIEKIESVIGE